MSDDKNEKKNNILKLKDFNNKINLEKNLVNKKNEMINNFQHRNHNQESYSNKLKNNEFQKKSEEQIDKDRLKDNFIDNESKIKKNFDPNFLHQKTNFGVPKIIEIDRSRKIFGNRYRSEENRKPFYAKQDSSKQSVYRKDNVSRIRFSDNRSFDAKTNHPFNRTQPFNKEGFVKKINDDSRVYNNAKKHTYNVRPNHVSGARNDKNFQTFHAKSSENRSFQDRSLFKHSQPILNAYFQQKNEKKSFDNVQKKKKQVDKDQKIKIFKEKDDELKIHITDFVGRIDEYSLEETSFYDCAIRKKGKDKVKSFVKRDVAIERQMNIKELASALSMRANELLVVAKRSGLNPSLSEFLSEDILHLLIEECGHNAIRIDEKNKEKLEFPAMFLNPLIAKSRPPVVIVVGHVDHGKTTLLDYIRKTRVAKKEAGGITQNIGAYQVKFKDGDITFIDTPGHEAFAAMRSRGVKVSDIAILVVASNDGVKAQTIEAINYVKSAKIPIIVAVTKCDLPTAEPEKIKQELLGYDVIANEYGGDITFVNLSAISGNNIDKLLQEILLLAQIMDLKANQDVEARGIVLESKINPKAGPTTTLLVQQGILKKTFCIAGISSGKIKAMHNDVGDPILEAYPSMPVEIVGFDIAPKVGEQFASVIDMKIASEILKARKDKNNQENKSANISVDIDNLFKEELPSINIVIRAATQGVIEALQLSFDKLNQSNCLIKIVLSGIGPVKESDVDFAIVSRAEILSFDVKNTAEIRKICQEKNISLMESNIIYEIIENLEKRLLKFVKKEEKEILIGKSRILKIFSSSKLGNIAGCIVNDGIMKRGAVIKILRAGKIIATTVLESLKRTKDDAKEVANGFECGIMAKNFSDFEVDDEIHCFKIET